MTVLHIAENYALNDFSYKPKPIDMNIKITARHFRIKDSLKNFATEKLEDLMKFHENILHADMILSYDKPPSDLKYCELIIKLRNKHLATKEHGEDFEKAINAALNKIETQIYKYKDKTKTRKHIAQKQNNQIK